MGYFELNTESIVHFGQTAVSPKLSFSIIYSVISVGKDILQQKKQPQSSPCKISSLLQKHPLCERSRKSFE
jgi:hypothetical protein